MRMPLSSWLRCVRFAAPALLTATSAALAQSGSIAGKVIDRDTRIPVEGAVVSIAGTTTSVMSLANGSFSILGVLPGFHTVTAKRVGFATMEFTRVEVRIGKARTIEIALRAAPVGEIDRLEAEPIVVEPTAGSSALSLDRDDIVAFPSLSLAGSFALGGGYVEIPRSAATVSVSDLRRGITTQPSVRGGRANATEYLIDGIPVNNPVFGASPLLLDPLAAAGVSFSPGFVNAEHGGALSGLVTQAIREGGDHVEGSAEVYSTAPFGMMGSRPNLVSGVSAGRAYLAGPMMHPSLRFSVAGHVLNERATVTRSREGAWIAEGNNSHQQLVGKLAYMRPSFRLSVAALAQHRGGLTYEAGSAADSIAVPTVGDNTRLLVARAEKRFSRANYSLSVATIDGRRESCSVWEGVCIGDRIRRVPLPSEIPIGFQGTGAPYAGSGQFYGGETYRSTVIRADAMLQATDHHQLRGGILATSHDITYSDAIGVRLRGGLLLAARDVYRVAPREFSAYVQDAFEHDLITVRLGARFDYANTGGVAFANTLDPTNGTNARDVCLGLLPGVSETPYAYGELRGLDACYESPLNADGFPVLLDSAVRLAQRDDFRTVQPRSAFSPRIAVSFPLTETSGLFVNYGRFVRNPRYHDAFRYSGVGSRAGSGAGTDGMCPAWRTMPGTDECTPTAALDRNLAEFVGNPALPFEKADAFEAGFTTRVGERHVIDATFFSNTQSHLASLYMVPLEPDPGLTYGLINQYPYRAVVGRGSIATQGFTLTLRRPLHRALSYVINYSWQSSSELGAHPDLLAEAFVDSTTFDNSLEYRTARSRPHSLNAQFTLLWRDNPPEGLGRVGAAFLRNSRTVATIAMASGSRSATESQPGCGLTSTEPCAAQAARVAGTGTIVNLMYAKGLTTGFPQWTIIARVQNLLDQDDGSMQFIRAAQPRANSGFGGPPPGSPIARPLSIDRVSLRRVLAGLALSF